MCMHSVEVFLLLFGVDILRVRASVASLSFGEAFVYFLIAWRGGACV